MDFGLARRGVKKEVHMMIITLTFELKKEIQTLNHIFNLLLYAFYRGLPW
jgi:hypothetical protein